MKCKSLSLSIAVLLCLMAMPFLLSNTAFAGVGCGSNWMGDTTGDTDFYVSKNQNQGTSDTSSTAQTSSSKPAMTLGKVAKADNNATIQSINPDKPSPQSPGSVIVWKVEASNPNNEKMLYKFLLLGPSTGGQPKDETGWIAENSWIWNATDADAGENQIEVQVMRAVSAGIEDSKAQSYVIAAIAQAASSETSPTSASSTAYSTSTTSSETDIHPESRTGEPISDRPRVAPDERKSVNPTTIGPNMQMPDTQPKPLNTPTTAQGVAKTAEVGAEQTEVESQEPEYMEVEGKWTVKLENYGATLNPLTIFQTGASVMGMGTLNEKNTKLQVSAKGTVSNNVMSLDLWTVVSKYGNKIDKRISIELVKADRAVSGSYEIYSGEDLIGKGNATATRFAS